jgi:2-oxoglutarate ferredoxin oxidoreductase subunit alpha
MNVANDLTKAQAKVIQGNEACVEGALYAGCRFFAGYPITPASEIMELMSKRIWLYEGSFMQMEDELASICAVIGAAWGGVKSCTASSGPGISLMQEGIGYAAVTETPCVVINVMRGGPATGQPTLASQQDIMQAKYGSHGDYEIIALTPSSAQESYDLTVKAFNLAEIYRVPVYVLLDEIVGHTREKVIANPLEVIPREKPPLEGYLPFKPEHNQLLSGMPSFNMGYNLLIDGQLHDEYGNRAGHDVAVSARLVKRLCEKITGNSDKLLDVEELFLDDAEVVLVCFGSSSRPALEAVYNAREKGIKAGIFRLRVLFPFPSSRLGYILFNAKSVIIPEMNIGKLYTEVQRVVGDSVKVVSIPKLGGELHAPEEIYEIIEKEVKEFGR